MNNIKKEAIDAMLLMSPTNNMDQAVKYQNISKIMLIGGENFNSYCNSIELSGKKALIPCGSGDQTLELVQKGFEDITAFDINKLSRHTLNLKKAAILTLDYEEYLIFIKDLFSNQKIINKIFTALDSETKEFLERIMTTHTCYRIKSTLFSHTYLSTDLLKRLKTNFSFYNAKKYYELKKKLCNVTISFQHMDLYNPDIKEKYDFIYFSNILLFGEDDLVDTFTKDTIKEYLSSLKKDGTLGLHYAHFYKNETDDYVIQNIDVKSQRKNDFIVEKLSYLDPTETIVAASGYGHGTQRDDMILSYRK